MIVARPVIATARATGTKPLGVFQVSNCTGNFDSSRNHRSCSIIGANVPRSWRVYKTEIDKESHAYLDRRTCYYSGTCLRTIAIAFTGSSNRCVKRAVHATRGGDGV